MEEVETFFKSDLPKNTKSKGRKAYFSKKTKEAIFKRDMGCIECGKSDGILDYHHCWFSQETNYGEDRNDVTQGVCIHRELHLKAHGCKKGEGIRKKCINYLKNYYETKL